MAEIKTWTKGVLYEAEAQAQLERLASMPFIYKHIAVMPDVHAGLGSTIGSVFATRGAIIPAAVGVDIGCGMMAYRTSLSACDLPDSLSEVRSAIEGAVPVGFAQHEDPFASHIPEGWKSISEKHPDLHGYGKNLDNKIIAQVGTLGGGNHFIEICLDESDRVWVMLHSGSRGIGNCIGRYFIELAKQDMRKYFINLPDQDLAYLPEGTDHYDDYLEAVEWAQNYARYNRETMMSYVLDCLHRFTKHFDVEGEAINCHHNYVSLENHFGQNVYVTRKGAVRARTGEMGIIPGSMGTRSYIVRGRGALGRISVMLSWGWQNNVS